MHQYFLEGENILQNCKRPNAETSPQKDQKRQKSSSVSLTAAFEVSDRPSSTSAQSSTTDDHRHATDTDATEHRSRNLSELY